MKPTSPLSLLLFLQLTSAAPLRYFHGTSQCPSGSCPDFPSNGHTPATKLSDPHFPSHQLFSSSEEPIDNSPYTPTSNILPSEALAAERPLSSSYLKTLSNPATLPSIQKSPVDRAADALPSKPTSALPTLRLEDAKRYWASQHHSSSRKNGEEVSTSDSPIMPGQQVQCGNMEMQSVGGGYFLRMQEAKAGVVVREYSDVMVVGIVLLFLVIVVCIEAVEKFGDLKSTFTGNRRRKHGEIFLQDDETVAWIVKKPFLLQPAPPARYKIKLDNEKGFETTEGFQYDSDADERV
ncbi:hypothetical protein LSUE1_G005698 [Lachnellula suecica]|uniref:Uncharacterized protein n=1 Tax=Lachnellula suecica TaxID=602035 RepID=A0A8T9C510_9HELO|nr:hypothetical protein LSUE1_G005698 [Lachnellula suecica]